jgi:DNA-binding transcriptional regulator YhcF (GntR family)
VNSTAGTAAIVRQVQAPGLQWFTVRTDEVATLGQGPAQLLGLIRAHARRTGKAFPAWATMARELAVSRATVYRWLRPLRRAGLVTVTRTGRASVYELAEVSSVRRQKSHDETSHTEGVRRLQERVVVADPAIDATNDPAETTTTPSILEESELPDPTELREDRAEAAELEAAWSQAAPESEERQACGDRRRWCDTRLTWLEDVRRVAEAVEKLPGWRGHRGTGGVRSIGDLWRLRMEFDRMPSDVWRRSVLAWCRHHAKHPHRRIGDLGGWLLRERCEELPPMPDCPDLPPMPLSSETTATESKPLTLYRCRHDEGACQFYRVATEEGEEPPGCVWCGDPMVACD